jgi:uncharacterized membrane protein/thiol-disulfide isomerase/thioredoxin
MKFQPVKHPNQALRPNFFSGAKDMRYLLNKRSFWLIIVLLLLGVGFTNAAAQTNAVHAVLFFSPTCPHCHTVMNEDLPPLQEFYGEQLVILEVDVTTQAGQALFQQAIRDYSVPDDRFGVPAMAVGESYLVGADEIPNILPEIITTALEGEGLAWPDLNNLESYIERYGLTSSERPSVADRYLRDPVGNSISTILLLVMVGSLLFLGWSYLNNSIPYGPWPKFILPILLLIGIGASAYLTFVEFTQNEAICGPLGDCNAVQSSSYAYLFGIIPVALLGLIGYISMAAALAAYYLLGEPRKQTAGQVLWWFALLGTAFSIYLTFLEPFVIGATCAWCLVSATTVTAVLWGSSPLVLGQSKKAGKRRAARKARSGPIR